MSFWTFSDVFEEEGAPRKPFYGRFGIIAEDNIPKPSFNAFALLHKLGDTRLPSDSALGCGVDGMRLQVRASPAARAGLSRCRRLHASDIALELFT